MEELELKHLAPYLPYGLKGKSNNGQSDSIDELKGLYSCHDITLTSRLSCYNSVDYSVDYENFKPVLRPMSDLTNDVLRKTMNLIDHSSHIDWTTNEREYLIKKRGLNGWLNEIPYIITLFLFENHFDVFDLIEKGLAIDINTLNK